MGRRVLIAYIIAYTVYNFCAEHFLHLKGLVIDTQ